MTQQADDGEGWDFDLGETVTLLWSVDATGLVIGRTEYVHEDVKYLVEYPDTNGRLARTWVYGEAIDHMAVH